jgi:Coenzyme F390 synthetase
MNEKLNNIIYYAKNNVPFYQEYDDVFDKAQTPLITKNIVFNRTSDLIADDYKYFPLSDKLVIRRTSGSTGEYMKIHWDIRHNIKSHMELWFLRKKYYNIHPKDKYCYFYTTYYTANSIMEEKDIMISSNNRSIGFSKNSLTDDRLKEIYLKILDFSPKYILGQPSMLLLLAKCKKDYDLPDINSLVYIELTGEMLFDYARKEIMSTFNCIVANQYGCNEANSIAYECPCGNMHIMESNVYVEILNDSKNTMDGEEGEIYITSLTNYAMPFIRYDIGDIGYIEANKKCECGNNSPILHLTKGRNNDFVLMEDGKFTPAYIFVRPIEFINEKIGNIIYQFQVIQNDINNFTVRLTINKNYNGWKNEIEKLFISNIKHILMKNANYSFEYYDKLLPKEESGKLAYFIKNF